MTHRKHLLITTAALALAPFAAQAAVITDNWLGGTSTAWLTAGNWDNGVPGTNYSVVIPSGTTFSPEISSAVNLNVTTTTGPIPRPTASLTINGAKLTIDATGSITMASHALNLNGGTISASTTLGGGALNAPALTGNGTVSGITITGGTLNASGGALNLTNDVLNTLTLGPNSGTGGVFNISGTTLNGVTFSQASSQVNLTGNSTLTGFIARNNTVTFNTNANTLSLKGATVTGVTGGNVFAIGTGGLLDNASGTSSVANDGTTSLQGGKISNSGGGSFTFNDPVSGFGTITGPMTFTGGVTASGGTLTVDGTSGPVTISTTSWQTGGKAGDVLDLKGTFNYTGSTGFLNPTGATVQLDGATLNTPSNSGSIWVGNSASQNGGLVNVASGTNTVNGNIIPNGSNGSTANFNVANGATFSLQNASTTINTGLQGTNFNMENNSKLVVGASHNAISLRGNFSYQQTDTIHGWTNGSTQGLGPDLIMTGGTSSSPTTLEAGSINKGNNLAALVHNFALDSLTLGTSAYVDLVDTVANATGPGWTPGTETLYVDGLFGVVPGKNVTIPTLNLGGLYAYDLTCPTGEALCHTWLMNGLYTDANGGEINIIGAPAPTPEPATLALFGTGLLSLGLLRRRRR
jgi:hypothetical protein